MAKAVHIAGAAHIKVGTGSAGALEELGYTRNGADLRPEGYFLNVPGDENGGDDGPPIEVIYMGETAQIRVELTKFDVAVADRVACRVRGGTAGTPSAAGTALFAGSYTMRVLVHTTAAPMNFPRCIPREPIEINKGTKFSTLIFQFEAHKDGTGVLYNAVTS
jgi:hypothetical protein